MAKTDQNPAEPDATTQPSAPAPSTPTATQEPPKKRYRNISSTPHTLHPDGRLFNPGDEDYLNTFDAARLGKVGHIWELPESTGGK